MLMLLASLTCFVWAGYLIWQKYSSGSRLAFASFPVHTTPVQSPAEPRYLYIPDLNLTLPLVPGEIKHHRWPVAVDGVTYLTTSPLPGTAGNSILYGPRLPEIFGRLHLLKNNQLVQIVNSDGSCRNFRIRTINIVSPDKTSVLEPTSDTRITLYTSHGILARKRLVVSAVME